eukprot:CAMPEP_0204882502 /NCGR_PEP_ID=MMETSP1349-20130617/3513_1 /ASSEMBLY_ACC=CAM_ASM_000710 /TAXON_ID=215587 /ORGANISM="Aplanochytrium stocchinoi, Strain GSBS06" /LENGTH=325 /DNA_ID=CAMNT_0052041871 /DNA_START=51 /DNA_END=1025 /DNA_ORIENTATION=+
MGGRELIGILVEIFVADLLTVIGLSGQKLAIMRAKIAQEEILAERRRISTSFEYNLVESSGRTEVNMVKDPKWLLAFVIFILGQASEAISLSFASQTDVVSVSNLTLFWNSLFSVFLFREKFTLYPTYPELSLRLFRRWDLFSVTLLVAGSIITVLATPQPDEKGMTVGKLMSMWFEFPYCIYATFLAVSIAACAIALTRNWGNEATGNLNAVLVATASAMISAFTVTISKVEMTLLGKTIKGENQFTSFSVFFMSFLWILSMVASIWLLNVGLSHFEQGLIVPIYEVVGTLVTITSGILYYKTYDEFDVGNWVGFIIGLFCMCW